MDFLKSAVASAISKGPPFPYAFGDKVDVDGTIWTLHNGTRRDDGSNCSIFSIDLAASRRHATVAKNALRKLRTLRHPGVIKVLDTVETESYIYIATERLTPLSWHIKRDSLSSETRKWGLYSIAVSIQLHSNVLCPKLSAVGQNTLRFINDEATSVHGNVRHSSVFTNEAGEWKLAGFEVLSSLKDDDAVIYSYGSTLPEGNLNVPPEIATGGWDVVKRQAVGAADAYLYGALLHLVFTGNFNGGDQLAQTRALPPSMQQSYKRLINANPKSRLSVGHFLDQGRRTGGFFETPLIRLTDGVESLGLKSESEREAFMSELDELSDEFPEDFLKMRILPELMKSVEFGGGGPKVFARAMEIASKLTDDEYESRITPVIVRLFASPDRAMRVCLLDNLHFMIDHLPEKVVNNKIFPQLVTGFTDVAPVVREQTVKAVLTIIGKLSDRTVNGELLKYLAKTSNDEQPGIRTNTTICLGKIAKNLAPSTRQKVLTAAFVRSLRDPFVHARNAALMALAATSEFFTEDDCANRLLPGICPSLIDKEKLVRDQANKTLDIYLQRVRKYGSSLPDTALPPTGSSNAAGVAAPRMAPPQSDASWSGWAISSFTNKIAAASGDMQSGANGVSAAKGKDARSTSAPPAAEKTRPTPSSTASASASVLHRQAVASPGAPTTKSSTFEDGTANDDNDVDAWAEMEDDAFFEAAETPSVAPAAAFDDGGEPDFAGWLSAQAQAKSKQALPKGLAKTSTRPAPDANRPGVGSRGATTGSVGVVSNAAKASVTMTKKPIKTATKTLDLKPKEAVDEEDGWGDGW
ncbi:MAG: hypothetical protein M1817_006043 [Caeruleum heppii]|nr:MAG: hypothetical protein M1817_006043 [Caeruleum heppii]